MDTLRWPEGCVGILTVRIWVFILFTYFQVHICTYSKLEIFFVVVSEYELVYLKNGFEKFSLRSLYLKADNKMRYLFET